MLGCTQRGHVLPRNCSVDRHSVDCMLFTEGPQSREPGPVHLPIGSMFVNAPFVISTHDGSLTDATFFLCRRRAAPRTVWVFLSNGPRTKSMVYSVIVLVDHLTNAETGHIFSYIKFSMRELHARSEQSSIVNTCFRGLESRTLFGRLFFANARHSL